jgi:hypothetical protein
MAFVYLVLSALYEPKKIEKKQICMLHPLTKNKVTLNSIADYVADMSVMMTYLKGRDDWKDAESIKKSAGGRVVMDMMSQSYKRVKNKYPKKTAYILSQMKKIDEGEKQKNTNIDYMAGIFGNIMGEIFCLYSDVWEKSLRKTGFYLGKFIYLMDAYDDIEKDLQTDNYNAFFEKYNSLGKDGFEEYAKKVLLMMMAECTKEFETLPILENAELIRNILYSGVWSRFKKVSDERKMVKGEAADRLSKAERT